MPTPTATATTDHRESFVRRFELGWASGDVNELMPLLDERVRLRQPMLPQINGRAEAEAIMGRFIECVPGIHAEVHGWVPTPTGVLIEFDLVVPGRRELRWGVVDRFDLRNDIATFRISYWDLRMLAASLLRRPDVLINCWRAGARMRGARVTGERAIDIPAPLSGRRGELVICERLEPASGRRAERRFCISRGRDEWRPRVYVTAPFDFGSPGAGRCGSSINSHP